MADGPRGGTGRRLLLTGLGTGYLPIAPGTWGSAGPCAIYLVIALAAEGKQVCLTGSMIVLAAVCTLLCGLLGKRAEKDFGKKDPGAVTIDEWAGQAVALCALPLGAGRTDWLIAVGASFFAFRVFDIIKPPPASTLEKLSGGWGIVADDLAAGVMANVTIQLILRLGPGWS